MAPPFAKTWKLDRGVVATDIGGVRLEARERWWGRKWNLTGTAPFPVPDGVVLFVSRAGMDHGYWRDFGVGDGAFDRSYFVFCDTPALVEFFVGPATRAAIGDVVLHVRRGIAETTSLIDSDDAGAVDRHVAIHRALADDFAAFVARWQRVADVAGGRLVAGWPPSVMLHRPLGSISMDLSWTKPYSRDGLAWVEAASSLRTELTTAVGAKRGGWWLEQAVTRRPSSLRFGDRWFDIHGPVPMSRHLLGDLVARANIAWITCADYLTIAIPGMVTDTGALDAAVRIVENVCAPEASQSPFR